MEMKNSPRDYIDVLSEKSDRFTALGLSAFKLYVKVLGTECVVTRIKDSVDASNPIEEDANRYKKLLKATMNIAQTQQFQATEQFTHRFLIHRSQFSNRYQKMYEELQITYIEDVLRPGDLIEFRYLGYKYKYKVAPAIESFGLQDGLIFRATLNAYRESK